MKLRKPFEIALVLALLLAPAAAFADDAMPVEPAVASGELAIEAVASLECATTAAAENQLAAALLGPEPLEMGGCAGLSCQQCCDFSFNVCWDSCFINPPWFPCALNCENAYSYCIATCT
jgi:hypothetical protein